eukprot:Clim_evm53s232 gene=Clim_evmTU53s232
MLGEKATTISLGFSATETPMTISGTMSAQFKRLNTVESTKVSKRRQCTVSNITAKRGQSSAATRPAQDRSVPLSTVMAQKSTNVRRKGTMTGRQRRPQVCTIVESRGVGCEIGCAFYDPTTPYIEVCQFTDWKTYPHLFAKIHTWRPGTIIFPDSAIEKGDMLRLVETLVKEFGDDADIRLLPRRFFKDQRGAKVIQHTCIQEDVSTLKLELESKFYALASVASLFHHLEVERQLRPIKGSVKFIFNSGTGVMVLDYLTMRNLEVLKNSSDNTTPGSLFSIVNYTATKMGARALRSRLAQPPANLDTIEGHVNDVVWMMYFPKDLNSEMKNVLHEFPDIDGILSRIAMQPGAKNSRLCGAKVVDILKILSFLTTGSRLLDVLQNNSEDSGLIQRLSTLVSDKDYTKLIQSVGSKFDEPSEQFKLLLDLGDPILEACIRFKSKERSLANVTKLALLETLGDLDSLTAAQNHRTGMDLVLAYTITTGFHWKLPDGVRADDLPDHFAQVRGTSGHRCVTTLACFQLNNKFRTLLDDLINCVYNSCTDLIIEDIVPYLSLLHTLTETVAEIDLARSLAIYSQRDKKAPPQIGTMTCLVNASHPLIDYGNAQPFTVTASPMKPCKVILGQNMSGKSTTLKMLGTLQILAQCGSFVPAQQAFFRPADRIFSRMGSDDDLESSCSSFAREMRETSYALRNVTDSSLVLLDELGRGTADTEGRALAWAILEEFINRSNAFVFLSTHYQALAHISYARPEVDCLFITYHRKKAKGEKDARTISLTPEATQTDHAIELAREVLPTEICDDAEEVLKDIRQGRVHRGGMDITAKPSIMQLYDRLADWYIQVNLETDDPAKLNAELRKIKQEYDRIVL